MDFEPTGDLFTDLEMSIDHGNAMQIDYTDRKGVTTQRRILPIEVRNDRVYVADLDKMALRLFILASIGAYDVLDETYDKDALQLVNS